MNAIAVLAAKEAALASGLGASLLPGIAPSAVDGFAAGTLLSGVCFLLVIAPRRLQRRSRLSGRDDGWSASHADPAQTAYSAAPGYANPYANPSADQSAGADDALPADAVLPADAILAPDADQDVERLAEPKGSGYHSKHRLPGSESDRRADPHRTPGRHAAPSVTFGSRMASKLSFHPLAVRD